MSYLEEENGVDAVIVGDIVCTDTGDGNIVIEEADENGERTS